MCARACMREGEGESKGERDCPTERERERERESLTIAVTKRGSSNPCFRILRLSFYRCSYFFFFLHSVNFIFNFAPVLNLVPMQIITNQIILNILDPLIFRKETEAFLPAIIFSFFYFLFFPFDLPT